MKRLAWLAGGIAMLDAATLYFLVPLGPTYAAEFGISGSSLGVLWAACGVAAMAGALATPHLIRRSSHAGVVLAALLVVLGGLLLTGFAATLTSLCLGRALHGLGGGAALVGIASWLARVTPMHKMGRALSVLPAAAGLGMLLGPPIGGSLSRFGGHSTPFLLGALLCLPLLALAALSPSPKRAATQETMGSPPKALWGVLLTLALAEAAMGSWELVLPFWFKASYGFGPLVLGGLFALIAAFSILASLLAGAAIERFGWPKVLSKGLLLLALTPLSLMLGDALLLAVLACLLLSFGWGIPQTAALPAIADLSASTPESGMALATVAMLLGFTLGPLVGAFGLLLPRWAFAVLCLPLPLFAAARWGRYAKNTEAKEPEQVAKGLGPCMEKRNGDGSI